MTDNLETFNDWHPYQYLSNVYLGILISVTQGQANFATSPLYPSQWEKNEKRLFWKKAV